MSNWVDCPCGHAIGLGAFPNHDVFRLISEEQYEAVEDPVDRPKLARLFLSGQVLVRCPDCRRVLVKWADGADFESFTSESLLAQ